MDTDPRIVLRALVDDIEKHETTKVKLEEAKKRIDAKKKAIKEEQDQKAVDAIITCYHQFRDDPKALWSLCWYLYWKCEYISSSRIEGALGLILGDRAKRFMKNIKSSAVVTFVCDSCQQSFQIDLTSRTDYQNKVKGSYHHTCPSCEQKREEAYRIEMETRKLEDAKHLEQLRTMPYQDYLKTTEWQETRKRALKRAGFRCQICNQNKVLNVHHRTYENRGNEDNKDLIVLCEDCHRLYHFNGSLK